MKRKMFISLFGVLAAFVWMPAYAQRNEPPIPEEPPPGIYILDTLDWLTSQQEAEINALIERLDQDGLTDMAVVTLNDCGTNKTNYRKSFLQAWSIGHVDDKDGLLILVCWYGGDKSRRSVEQEFGPGMNGILSSTITDRVAKENFVPAFQNDRPGDGLVAMVKNYDAILRSPKPAQSPSSVFFDSAFLFPFIFCGLLPMSILVLFARWIDKNSTNGGYSGGGDFGGDAGGGGDSGSSTSF
ncbi:MAG TPA: TPM domain-containing protein [Anaerolineales bacterium]|nr:TPM domain-containing protein [Anaerolineales bacterium]